MNKLNEIDLKFKTELLNDYKKRVISLQNKIDDLKRAQKIFIADMERLAKEINE